MLAYVINLDRSPERMVRMKQLLDYLGIPLVRVPAADGRQLAAPPGIEAGYYGNFLSHIKCWEMIAAGSEPAGLCLEDDVVFARNFTALWADKRLGSVADIVRLEASNKVTVGRKKASLAGGYAAHPLLSQGIGTAAYVVTKAGASWLLSNAKPVNNIDLVVFGELLGKGMEMLTLVPSPCIQYQLVDGLPRFPSIVSSTLDASNAGLKPLKPVLRLQAALLKMRQRLQTSIQGRARVRAALHPSGPLVL